MTRAIDGGAPRHATSTPTSRREFLSLLGVGAAGAALAACGPSVTGAAPTTAAAQATASGVAAATARPVVKLSSFYSAVSAGVLPLWLAIDEGIFKKYGLDVDLTLVQPSTTAAQAMTAGQLQIGSSGASAHFAATLSGAEQIAISTTIPNYVLFVIGKKGLTKIEDLKGKRLGVSRFGSLTDSGARLILQKVGLQADKDVTFIQMGGMNESVAGLQGGSIDAASLTMPTSVQAEKLGFTRLFDISDLKLPYWQEGLIANRSWIEKNRPLALDYLRAYIEGIRIFKSDKAKRTAALAKWAKITDISVAEEAATYYANLCLTYPVPSAQEIRAALDEIGSTTPKAKDANPVQFMDTSLVEDLKKSGFVS